MKIQVVLLTGILFSYVSSENTDFFDEDLIDPSDMLHYDAASQTMKTSKQRKLDKVLKYFVQRTLEDVEKLNQPTTDEEGQYHAEITISSQTLRDFLKCIKENDCNLTVLEEHLQNIQFRLKNEDGNSLESMEIAIFLYIILAYLDLVKNFTLTAWLVLIKIPLCKLYQVYKKCLEKIFHRNQNLHVQQCPQNAEEELCLSIQEVPIPNVNVEGPGVESKQKLSSKHSHEKCHGKSKSNTDCFKNSEIDKEHLLKEPKGPKDIKVSKSASTVPKLLDDDNLQDTEDLSYSGKETFENIESAREEFSESLSFVVLNQEQQDN